MTHCLKFSVCTKEKVLCPHVQFVFQKLKWICCDGESKLVEVGFHGVVSAIWVCMITVFELGDLSLGLRNFDLVY